VQIAHYLQVWEAATGEKRRMRLVFVEKEPPYEISVVELLNDPGDDGDWMQDASRKCDEARRIWSECMTDNQWPGYPGQVAIIGAPVWHRKTWAERETGLPVTRAAMDRARAWQSPLEMETQK
jgi:hypothetical protein